MVRTGLLALLSALLGAAAIIGGTQTQPAGAADQAVKEVGLHGTPAQPSSSEPANVPLSPMKRGDILMARKMYREAIETYQNGIRDTAILYNKIGIGYHQLMDFKAALRNYSMALKLDPTYSEAINNIGAVYYARHDNKRAIKQYRKALKYAPKSASIYSNLGTAYFARKKYKDAFKAYQEALALDPMVFEHRNTAGSLLQERSVAERAKFHFYLAKTYARAGMVTEAISYVRKSLEEGFKDKNKFIKDPDFAKLQDNEEFQTVLAAEYRVL